MKYLKMITIVEFKLFMRNFFNVAFALVFPLFLMLLYGSIYGNKPDDHFGGRGIVDVSVPGYACMVIAVTGLLCLPITVARYRERKILKRFMATPISPMHILASQIVVNFVMSVVGIAVLLLLGKIVFGLHFPAQWLGTAVSLIFITLCMFSMGILIAGVIPDTRASTAVSFLVYFPMLFLSGAGAPGQVLPENMERISSFLPLTHGVKLIDGVWAGGALSAYSSDILFLLAVFVICTALSSKLFRWET